jgi:hypothetical protein
MRPAEEPNFRVLTPYDPPNFRVLTPYDPREGMKIGEAAKRSGKSKATVKNWCIHRGIGRRVAGGVWVISRPALEMLLEDDHAALLEYHSGNLTSPVVRFYFDRTGVPCPAGFHESATNTFLAKSAGSTG